ncbi:MAG: hypothetical protein H9789_06500 [Candidatus Paraprevotella stercoravium]|uniref:Uncharacterized protein n=2 Tax=Bacteroidales TaxID=171549 RepID=A0ABT7U4G2_9BACE|nr:hypothetical protein [Candidatus Paraprevotella stercoravium]MDM8145415.1 hypothetical protein [Bacteroides eggerthii]
MKSLLTLKKLILCLFAGLALCMGTLYAQNVHQIVRSNAVVSDGNVNEGGNVLKTKMLNSAFPVTIQLKGTRLRITSKYTQLLPVYNEKGAFYSMFRLNKGTNWIGGLPKGVYYINNRKVSIP